MTACAAGDEDGFSTAAARHYRSPHTQMLREILAMARRGALRPDWRDRLATTAAQHDHPSHLHRR